MILAMEDGMTQQEREFWTSKYLVLDLLGKLLGIGWMHTVVTCMYDVFFLMSCV